MSQRAVPHSFDEWVDALPEYIKSSPLWRLRVYRDALFAFDLAKFDVPRLKRTLETRSVIPQFYRAVGSIGANIAEGSSRSSGADRKRFFEYALGSAREAGLWYHGCDHVLGSEITNHRRLLCNRIAAQLVALIPTQRNLREDSVDYEIDDESDDSPDGA